MDNWLPSDPFSPEKPALVSGKADSGVDGVFVVADADSVIRVVDQVDSRVQVAADHVDLK